MDDNDPRIIAFRKGYMKVLKGEDLSSLEEVLKDIIKDDDGNSRRKKKDKDADEEEDHCRKEGGTPMDETNKVTNDIVEETPEVKPIPHKDIEWLPQFSSKVEEMVSSGCAIEYACEQALRKLRPAQEAAPVDEDERNWPKHIINRINKLEEYGLKTTEESVALVREKGYSEFGKMAVELMTTVKANEFKYGNRSDSAMSKKITKAARRSIKRNAKVATKEVRTETAAAMEGFVIAPEDMPMRRGNWLNSLVIALACICLGMIAFAAGMYVRTVVGPIDFGKQAYVSAVNVDALEERLVAIEEETEYRKERDHELQVMIAGTQSELNHVADDVADIKEIISPAPQEDPMQFQVDVTHVEGSTWMVGENTITLPKWMGIIDNAEISTHVVNETWTTGKTMVIFTDSASHISFEVEIVRGAIYSVNQL